MFASFVHSRVSAFLRASSCRRLPSLLFLSTNTVPVVAKQTIVVRGSNWILLGRAVRYLRIPFLVVSVYGLGYQQGIIDDSRNPQQTRGALLDNVLAGVGASRDTMDVIHDGEAGLFSSTQTHAETKRVAAIGRKLVQVAKIYVKNELKETEDRIQANLPSDKATYDQLVTAFAADQPYQQWTMALRRLEGDWSYLILQTKLPNAFVTEILPRQIFITTAMFQFIENDDELALILVHEISHLILGHLTKQNGLETMLRTVEVLLLSMDPTEGIVALAIIGALATLRIAFTAAHSRDHEREADEIGMQFAAMACFNTKKAAKFFDKLQSNKRGGQTLSRWIRFVDTHPSSADRYYDLVLASDTENAEKYSTTTCRSVAQRLRMILK